MSTGRITLTAGEADNASLDVDITNTPYRASRLTPVKSTRSIRIITSLSVGVVLIASISWLGLGRVSGQISRIDVFAGMKDRPEKVSKALNYLLVGSDTREGLTKAQIKQLKEIGRAHV